MLRLVEVSICFMQEVFSYFIMSVLSLKHYDFGLKFNLSIIVKNKEVILILIHLLIICKFVNYIDTFQVQFLIPVIKEQILVQ